MNLKSTFCLLEHLTWVQGGKDGKRSESSARLGATATRRGKIELGGQRSIKCPNNIHFLECLSVSPSRNEWEARVEKWKEGR